MAARVSSREKTPGVIPEVILGEWRGIGEANAVADGDAAKTRDDLGLVNCFRTAHVGPEP
jgi:hypothetical protein